MNWEMFVVGQGDLLAYFLDPDKALQNIKRKVTAAEIGGAATIAFKLWVHHGNILIAYNGTEYIPGTDHLLIICRHYS